MRNIILSSVLVLFSLTSIAQYIGPKPISGKKAVKAFIKKHIDYPKADLTKKNQGEVKIGFTTDKTGQVTDYKITEGVTPSIDSAAINLFRLLLWNPATDNRKPAIGHSEFEIDYNIKSYNKNAKRRGYLHVDHPHLPYDTSFIIYGLKQLDATPIPKFNDNSRSLNEYIYGHLTYPEAASKLALEGEVEIMFIIETTGLPSNIIPVTHLGGGCTEEAIRIVESISWVPGIFEEKAVRTKYRIKIKFQKAKGKDSHIPNQQGSGI